jgi:hypothetical protein
MHFIIDVGYALMTCKVPLRGKYQIRCELSITIDCLNTLYYIPVVELQAFIIEGDFLALEGRAARHFIVNHFI